MAEGRQDWRGVPDDSLAALALRGCEEAWSEVARRHTHGVILALLARGVPLDMAEDLAQETWMRLMRQQREGRLSTMQLPGLAITQAGWLAREAARTRLRRRAIEKTIGFDQTGPDALDSAFDPEQLVIRRDLVTAVEKELLRCSARVRQIFLLVYGETSRSHEEAARECGLSTQRVRQILHETRARMRRRLAQLERERRS